MSRLRDWLDPNRLLDALDRFEAWNARQSPVLRIPLGIVLCFGGFLWFLPILGLWMLPVGLLVLSEDIPWLKNRREHIEAWLRKVTKAHEPKRPGAGGGNGRAASSSPSSPDK